MNLPPLPEPQYMDVYLGINVAYSQDQMLAFQQATVEACAKVADSVDNFANPMTATDVADAIRSMKHE